MPDFLDEKRREITARLKELKPLVDEYRRLVAAAAALDGLPASSAGAARSARASTPAPARRRRRGEHAGSGGRPRGRPKGSGTRAKEALELVKASPGITIPEMAERMGIKQNYLYRVLPGLEQDGLVAKAGRGWHPRQAS
jgi:hypothetical protein